MIARTEWYREGRVPIHTAARPTSTMDLRKRDDLRAVMAQGLGIQSSELIRINAEPHSAPLPSPKSPKRCANPQE